MLENLDEESKLAEAPLEPVQEMGSSARLAEDRLHHLWKCLFPVPEAAA